MIAINKKSKNINIDYLDVKPSSEIDNIVQNYFTRLNKIYKNCHQIKVKIANTTNYDSDITVKSGYLVSINFKLSENDDIYVLRQPESNYETELLSFAVIETFAILYRKLIEHKISQYVD